MPSVLPTLAASYVARYSLTSLQIAARRPGIATLRLRDLPFLNAAPLIFLAAAKAHVPASSHARKLLQRLESRCVFHIALVVFHIALDARQRKTMQGIVEFPRKALNARLLAVRRAFMYSTSPTTVDSVGESVGEQTSSSSFFGGLEIGK